jgi:probable rRNA maturation factor
MPFSVDVVNATIHPDLLAPERATKLCAAAFSACGLDVDRMGEVSVALVDLYVVHDLNVKFRDVDSPTDVLSFEVDGPYGEMVGEVVVAPEYVKYEPEAIEELVVHGALHLSGMDHGDDFEGSEMARVQRAVLEEVGPGDG